MWKSMVRSSTTRASLIRARSTQFCPVGAAAWGCGTGAAGGGGGGGAAHDATSAPTRAAATSEVGLKRMGLLPFSLPPILPGRGTQRNTIQDGSIPAALRLNRPLTRITVLRLEAAQIDDRAAP